MQTHKGNHHVIITMSYEEHETLKKLLGIFRQARVAFGDSLLQRAVKDMQEGLAPTVTATKPSKFRLVE